MGWTPFHEHKDRIHIMDHAEETMAGVMELAAKGGKTWDNIMDMPAAMDTVRRLSQGQDVPGLYAAMLNDSHLILYSLGAPWWGRGRWLIEQFFIRVGPGPSDKAMEALEDLAREEEASVIIMGTSLAADDAALGRLFSKHGYSPQSSQHTKEITWQRYQQSSQPSSA